VIPALERIAQRRVMVVGDVMLDRYWHGSVDRISPEAPVPVVRITREEERLGGAANVALNAKTLGARVTLMTVAGADEAASRLKRLLAQQGIDTRLGEDARLRTIVKLRVIGRAQQLLRIDFENDPDHEVLQQLAGAFTGELAHHDAVLFSDYGKGGLTHITQMIDAARGAGKPVLIDPKGSDYARYVGATVITPNRAELMQVVGAWSSEAQLAERAQNLRGQLQADALLLTRSEDGMSLFDDRGAVHEPAQTREVFDVTGAGDTVIATMAVLMAAGMSAREAMPHANRAGGIVVGKFGTASASYAELFG
jgi:D-glycero-beta-D-manno-heptose-7-phosphate kinase